MTKNIAKTYHREPIGTANRSLRIRLGRWYLEIGKIKRFLWNVEDLEEELTGGKVYNRKEIKNFIRAMEKRRKDETET